MIRTKFYNKLVRDRIPDIIAAEGGNPVTRILTMQEYRQELRKKLVEEAQELLTAITPDEIRDELADIEEVLHDIRGVETIGSNEVFAHRVEKLKKKGVFSNRIFLERVETEE